MGTIKSENWPHGREFDSARSSRSGPAAMPCSVTCKVKRPEDAVISTVGIVLYGVVRKSK